LVWGFGVEYGGALLRRFRFLVLFGLVGIWSAALLCSAAFVFPV
jgi:hypothetical protein